MDTNTYTDKHIRLIEQCRQGDRKAQYEIYRLYARAMFNVSMRMLNHAGEAEDVIQEAFTDAFHRIGQFNHLSTFGAWLKQIVVNKTINQLRQRKIQWVEMEAWQSADPDEQHAPYEHPSYGEDVVPFEVERIRHAIGQLPAGYRMVLSLYLFEGYDHEEISGILGISESTSRTQYLRAKQKLADLLKDGQMK